MNDTGGFDSLFAKGVEPLPQVSPATAAQTGDAPWKLLLVDDEPDIRAVLRLALHGVTVQGRALLLLEASSQAEARLCLRAHPDLAVMLLDVVMETERAGLDLVHHIRHERGDTCVQILLVTGQPGYAPLRQVITDYAIDGYRLKSELTVDKIFVSVCTALRAYQAQSLLLAQREELRHLASALQEREARLRAVIESAPDAIVLTNEHGLITGWNAGAERLFGYDAEEMRGHSLTRVVASNAPLASQAPDLALTQLEEGELPQWLGQTHEVEAVRRNGETFAVEMVLGSWLSAQGRQYSAILRDISDRKRMEAEIRQLAFYDPLTQLPNRRLLMERLDHAIAVCRRTGEHAALMMLDLDNFKPLNDRHGHEMGDLLLVEAARRMKHCIRSIDTVGRLGGDEFLFVVGELNGSDEVCATQALQIAEKIRLAVAAPYSLQSHHADRALVEHRCTATIGVTLIHADSTWASLFETADAAMYAAKEAGRNAVCFVDAREDG